MAVRHGYGKIAGADALVFAYDTGDTVNSYKGEPTENLLSGSTKQNISTWSYSTPGGVDCTALGETYRGGQVYRLQDADGVDPDVSVDNYVMYNSVGNVETGSQYAFSFDLRVIQKSNTNNAGGSGNGAWIWFGTSNTNIAFADYEIGEWNRVSMTVTAGASWDPNIDYIIPRIDYDNSIIDVANFQVEKKSHATPFVNGTRSATEGLKDLTGLGGIDLSNVSFDSNAQMTFDGTNDKIELGDLFDVAEHFTDNQSFTIESVVNIKADNGVRSGIFSNQRFYTETDPGGFGLSINTSGGTSFCMNLTDSTPASYQGQCYMSIDFGELQHIVYTYDSSTGIISAYRNGELQNTSTSALYNWTVPTNSTRTRIASNYQGGWGYYHEMDLPVVKCYNKALTAGEIRNNYSHYKNRFGI